MVDRSFGGMFRVEARIRDLVTIGVLAVTAVLLPVMGAKASTSSDADTSASLVSSARVSKGLPTLARSGGLDLVAQRHAERMTSSDAIFHNDSAKAEADRAGVNWVLIGENVGVGPDVQAVHDGFMASPGHRENILYGSYNAIGAGSATGSDGSVFIAQVFARVEAKVAPVTVKTEPAPVSEKAPAAPVVEPATAVQTAPQLTSVLSTAQGAVDDTPDPNAVIGGIVND